MKSKITREELQVFYNASTPKDFTQIELTTVAKNLLEPKEESDEFLIGLASGLLALAKTERLDEVSMQISAELIRQCAVEVIDRENQK
jgi:hypothetical protein